MKKFIIALIIFLLFAMSFENVKLTVEGAGGPVPFATVSLGNVSKLTDTSGNVSIIKTLFQNTVSVKRLGFKDLAATLPFSVFYLKYHIGLTPENYNGILSQLNEMLSGLSAYEYGYSLKVVQNGNSQTQSIYAKFNKGNFSFSNKSDFTGADYTVLYKNKNFYLVKDGERTLLEGEQKDEFIAKNIVFLSASDIVSSILLSDEPQNISYAGPNITILWKNAKAVLTVGENGVLSKLDFSQNTDKETIEVHFILTNPNGRVEL